MGSRGFYGCVDMIGEHPGWTLCIITNNSYNAEKLAGSRLAREGRLFITACWHPLGVSNRVAGWENFKKNLLIYRGAGVPVHVMMVWYRPQIKWFPEYFEWLDSHDFRVGVRRFVYDSFYSRIPFVRSRWKRVAGRTRLEKYSEAEKGFIYAYTCPKVQKYGLNLASTLGKTCFAGKDMILVKYDGTATLCAGCYGSGHKLGNVFDQSFRLHTEPVKCPSNTCGGDFGMLVLPDSEFGPLPDRMWRDNFVSQVEGIPEGGPVPYPHRQEMLEWLEKLKAEREKCER